MKRILFIGVLILFKVFTSEAQWTGTNPIYNTNLSSSVGIGTSTPSEKLQIKGGNMLIGNGSSPNANSGIKIVAPISSTHYNWMIAAQQNVDQAFEITPSTAVGGTTFSTPILTLKAIGTVGLGTTSPIRLLHLQKDVANGVGPGILLTNQQYSNNLNAETEIIFAHMLQSGAPFRYAKIHTVGIDAYGNSRLSLGLNDEVNDTYRDRLTILQNGNIGIGTIAPSMAKLQIKTTIGATSDVLAFFTEDGTYNPRVIISHVTAANDHYLLFNSTYGTGSGFADFVFMNGNVGIGTNSPDKLLKVRKDVANGEGAFIHLQNYQYANANNASTGVKFSILDGRYALLQAIGEGVYGQVARLSIGLTDDSDVFTERFSVLRNGNVLIGKTTQTNSSYKLDVNGKIRANEVVVNTTGADFVFGSDYKLLNLMQVEKYINENKHLPDVAPASEMIENGMNLSEMQTKLLQKIEELTLYIIEQNKTNELQSRQIESLEQEINELKKK